MDFSNLLQAIEAALRQHTTEFELTAPASDDGAVWGFELDDDVSGFVTLDANQGTFDVPTVALAVSLGDLAGASLEDFRELLAINGDLLGATLTVTPPLGPDQEEFLLLQTKFMAADFSEEMFTKSLTSLLTQTSLFFESQD